MRFAPLRLLPCLVAVTLVSACAASSTSAPRPAPAASPVVAPTPPRSPTLRLPAQVRPSHYALELTLVPSEPTYRGSVRIDLDLAEATRVLWLNAVDLKLGAAVVETAAGKAPAAAVAGEPGFVGFQLAAPVGPGKATLVVDFEGSFDKVRSQGLYTVAEGDAWYAYTFFEPIDARRAFPCFDEPGFKVPWQLTFHVRKDHVARANSPIVSETVAGESKTVVFADSKPMPSYLVAFMVGPFDVVDGGKVGRAGVPLQFVLPHGRGAETRYAAQVTPRIIELLEGYFGMPYPYEKLDVAVVPRFWGTMEHPGLVALGQPLTLIKPEEETVWRKQSYANTAIHELAHYWFGDYVTNAWWDDTWLNESLATWLDLKLTDALEPAWDLPMERRQQRVQAMNVDALVSAKRLRQPVLSRNEIAGSFDNDITYSKGSSVVAMFEHSLGEEKWRAFIRRYLAAHAWGNATTEDFLASLSAEAGPEVAAAFGTFVDKPGLPRVTVEVKCGAGVAPKLVLSQRRYLPAGSKGVDEGQTWSFPLCVRYGAGAQRGQACTLLTTATAELPLDAKSCPDWVMPNADGAGYYRVGYTPAQLPKLLASRAVLTVMERLSLLSDVDTGARNGDLPLGDALGLIPTLSQESDRHLLEASLAMVRLIPRTELSPVERERANRFLVKTFGARAKALGLVPRPGEGDDARELRPMLVPLVALASKDAALGDQARTLTLAWLEDRRAVHPEAVGPVLNIAAFHGDAALFERFLAEARKTDNRMDRSRLLFALGGFREPALAKQALALVVGGTFDLRESLGVLRHAFFGRESRELAWEYTKAHFDEFSPKMRDDDLTVFVRGAVSAFCDEPHRAELAAFFAPRVTKVDGAPAALAKELEKVELCVSAVRRNGPGVTRFLERY